MLVDDFIAIVRRFTAPDAKIHYHKTRFGPEDVISVLDYNYPRRRPDVLLKRGRTHEDWYISSFVCNMTVGSLPRWDIDGIWMEPEKIYDHNGIPIIQAETPYWALRPATGYKPLFITFLKEGLIVPSYELDVLLSYETRRSCTNANRLYYVSRYDADLAD